MRDVIVIGAGLAGSSLAAAAARAGWDVLLVEKDSFPRHKVCGEFLSPESQSSMRALGVLGPVAALGPAPMRRAALTTPAGRMLEVDLPGTAWGLSRHALDAALADAAAASGAEVRTGVSATAIEPAEGGSAVRLKSAAGQREERARAVVVACGRHQPPGLRAQQPAPPERTSVGVKCHYAGLSMPDQVELYLIEGGYVGLGPVAPGVANLCMLVRREVFRRGGADPATMVDAACQASPALTARLAGAHIVPETLLAVAPVDTDDRPAPWGGAAARLGDAAAMIPPLCGDGMAMALRSAELCAPLLDRVLRGELSHAGWEAAYRSAWEREFLPRLRVARRLQAALAHPRLAEACLIVGGLVPPLARLMVHATRGHATA